jgi:hypothetical protein
MRMMQPFFPLGYLSFFITHTSSKNTNTNRLWVLFVLKAVAGSMYLYRALFGFLILISRSYPQKQPQYIKKARKAAYADLIKTTGKIVGYAKKAVAAINTMPAAERIVAIS